MENRNVLFELALAHSIDYAAAFGVGKFEIESSQDRFGLFRVNDHYVEIYAHMLCERGWHPLLMARIIGATVPDHAFSDGGGTHGINVLSNEWHVALLRAIGEQL